MATHQPHYSMLRASVLTEGSQVGRYTIQKELGRGATSKVFLALDPMIDRVVALKILDLSKSLDREEQDRYYNRFLIESRAAGKLQHPGIVTIYDVGQDDERNIAFLALEFVKGPTLAAVLRSKRLPLEDSLRLARMILHALKYAHECGVIHRDIKPGNVILTRDGSPKITDFGIAKLADSHLTAEGTLLGSPNYMSPEQAQAMQVDKRTDIFSLGLVLYEMLTGAKAYPGTSIPDVLYQVVHTAPADLQKVRPDLPEGIAEIVGKAIEKDPQRRYDDAGAMLMHLKQVAASCPGGAGQPRLASRIAGPPAEKKERGADVAKHTPGRRRVLIGAGLLALAAVAVMGGLWLTRDRGGDVAQGAQGRAPAAVPENPGETPDPYDAGLLQVPEASPTPAEDAEDAAPAKTPTPQPRDSLAAGIPPATPLADPRERQPAGSEQTTRAGSTPGGRARSDPTPKPGATSPGSGAGAPRTAPSAALKQASIPSVPKKPEPFRTRAAHVHKIGKCEGVLVVYADRVEFVSAKHEERRVIRVSEVKKVLYKQSLKHLIFYFDKKSFARLGGSKQQRFILETPLPDEISAALTR